MNDIFLILVLLSLPAIVVGAIKPRWVMPWAATPKRLPAIGLYCAVLVASFVAFGVTSEPQEAATAEADTTEQATQEAPEPEPATIATTEPEPTQTEADLDWGIDRADTLAAEHMPEGQAGFIRVMEQAAADYEEALRQGANDLRLSRIDRQRRDESRQYTDQGHVTDWVGVLDHMGTNREGKAYVQIWTGDMVSFKTWNNALSDIQAGSLIPQDSPIYDALMDLPLDTPVRFSGRIVDEASVTEHGSVTQPEFIVVFSSIEPIN
ncbi:hypothetical protein [Halomonas sp. E14]|uniref:hypothetical protein n=1 Tax=Halomonas sp. E14 TaxID=3397245 RepID=UPI00403E7957